MRRIEFRRVAWGSSLVLGLALAGAAAPALAQDTGMAAQTRTEDRDDDSGRLGLVGLLGLAGLLGLRRREPDRVDRVDTTARTTRP